MTAPAEGFLRRARRAAATVVWLYLPLAVGWPALVAVGLWRRWTGAPPAGGCAIDLEWEDRAASPYRVAHPPAWLDEPALPPEAPRPGALNLPLPGPPVRVSK